jgi:hypothetical protein
MINSRMESYWFIIIGAVVVIILGYHLTKKDTFTPSLSLLDNGQNVRLALEKSPYRGVIVPCYGPQWTNYATSQVHLGNFTTGYGCDFNNQQWNWSDGRLCLVDSPTGLEKCLSYSPEDMTITVDKRKDSDTKQQWTFDGGLLKPKDKPEMALTAFPGTEYTGYASLTLGYLNTFDKEYQTFKML